MRTKKGVIASAKMKDTVSVIVHEYRTHPIYKKKYRSSKKFLADSAGYDVVAGDTVIITECRPLSKRKNFKITEIVEQIARVSDVQEEEALEAVTTKEKGPGARSQEPETEADTTGAGEPEKSSATSATSSTSATSEK